LIENSGDPLSNVAESNSIFLLRNQNKSKAMTNIAFELQKKPDLVQS
jgi:hypothetical protein